MCLANELIYQTDWRKLNVSRVNLNLFFTVDAINPTNQFLFQCLNCRFFTHLLKNNEWIFKNLPSEINQWHCFNYSLDDWGQAFCTTIEHNNNSNLETFSCLLLRWNFSSKVSKLLLAAIFAQLRDNVCGRALDAFAIHCSLFRLHFEWSKTNYLTIIYRLIPETARIFHRSEKKTLLRRIERGYIERVYLEMHVHPISIECRCTASYSQLKQLLL